MTTFKKIMTVVAVLLVLVIIIVIHQVRREPSIPSTEEAVANNEASSTESASGLYTYDNKDSKYSIKYPKDWVYDQSNPGTVIFSGKQGTPEYFSTVNIQTILTKKTGGDYDDVKAFMADINKQAKRESTDSKFLEHGPISIAGSNGIKLQGEYLIFTYKYKNIMFKQWQIVVLRNDGQVFYAWAYTSPVTQYEKDLPTAEAMLKTWSIY